MKLCDDLRKLACIFSWTERFYSIIMYLSYKMQLYIVKYHNTQSSFPLILYLSYFGLLLLVMDTQGVFAALYSVCEENAAFFSGGAKGSQGDAARRLVETMKLIQEHARSLEPVISGFAAVYHHFDFDPHIPANGYRSLVKVSPEKAFLSVWVNSLLCDSHFSLGAEASKPASHA